MNKKIKMKFAILLDICKFVKKIKKNLTFPLKGCYTNQAVLWRGVRVV